MIERPMRSAGKVSLGPVHSGGIFDLLQEPTFRHETSQTYNIRVLKGCWRRAMLGQEA